MALKKIASVQFSINLILFFLSGVALLCSVVCLKSTRVCYEAR